MDIGQGRQSPFSYCQRYTPGGISYLAHVFYHAGKQKESSKESA
jgi:primosomal replication protein N